MKKDLIYDEWQYHPVYGTMSRLVYEKVQKESGKYTYNIYCREYKPFVV